MKSLARIGEKHERRHSFKLPNIIHDNNTKHLCGIIIDGKEILNIMHKILNVLRQSNIDIKFLTCLVNNDSSLVIMVCDATNTNINIGKVSKIIKSLGKNLNVEIVRPRLPGLLAFPKLNLLMYSGERAVIYSSEQLYSVIVSAVEKFGIQGKAMMWHVWSQVGRYAYRFHKKLRRANNKLALEDQLLFGTSLGWWKKAEIVDYKDSSKTLKIRLWDNWECWEAKRVYKKTSLPQSHIVRGYLSGMVSEHFNVEMSASETRCIAMGDPYCEFILKPNIHSI